MIIRNIGMTYVKCTRFLDLKNANLGERGIVGDREFLLLDGNGAVMPTHHHGIFLPLTFDFSPVSEELSLTFADGRSISGSGASVGPVMNLDYLGMRRIDVRSVVGDWDAILSEFSGRNVRLVRVVNPGDGIDVLPITLITSASLSLLEEKLEKTVDPRRFRANLLIEHHTPFAEDLWDGRMLKVGTAILRVRSSVPRCIVTQLDPEHGGNDLAVVPTLGRFRSKVKLPDGLMPNLATPGFASYAEVIDPGSVSVGDRAVLM